MAKEALFVIVFGLGVYSFLIEPYLIKKEEIKVALTDIPLSVRQKIFVQISDLHFKKESLKTKKVLKLLKEIEPDYLLITGDLIDRKTKNLEGFQKFVKELVKTSKNPPLMVLGNHERENPRLKDFLRIIQAAGIKVLLNEKLILEDNIILVGIDDPHTHHDNIDKILPLPDDSPKIILAHSPEIFRKLNIKNGLVLCGHTHGGQVDIPPFTRFILPLSYDRQYKEGLFFKKDFFMYVNRGVGETFLPLRFNSLPEITIIKFESND